MRKLKKWTAEEASHVYWLLLWGCSPKDVRELSAPLLPNRSLEGINYMITEIRKRITELKKIPINIPSTEATRKIVRLASKIKPVKEISDLEIKDLDLVNFKPAGTTSLAGQHISKNKPKFEQLPDGDKNDAMTIGPLNHDKVRQLDKKAKDLVLYEKNELSTGGLNINQKEQPQLPIRQLSLEEVLQIAKRNGAKKVIWNGYTIKFN